jgi:hypothetical protein
MSTDGVSNPASASKAETRELPIRENNTSQQENGSAFE